MTDLTLMERSSRLGPTGAKRLLEAPARLRAAAALQRTVGYLLLFPFCGLAVFLMKFVGGYRINDLKEIRAQYREAARGSRPLMICANHLTFIDSALMLWALGTLRWYSLHYHRFSWNLPAGDFFKKKFYFRVVAYLSKCIFIHRDGGKDHHNAILGLCRELISRGEVVTIFPEGRRSRTGTFEVEKLAHGVGKLLSQIPDCRVLCVYLRGDRQKAYSNYPPRGSRFHIEMRVIEPRTEQQGREAYHDLTLQVGRVIGEMESRYINRC